jgi:hypothetical protein
MLQPGKILMEPASSRGPAEHLLAFFVPIIVPIFVAPYQRVVRILQFRLSAARKVWYRCSFR